MKLPSIRNILRLEIGLLAPMAIIAALAGPASGAALDPEMVQVQYLPRDGGAIVLWSSVDQATGYNVYQQEVTKPDNPSTATAPTKVNKDPITKVTSFMVDNLKNGTLYHFTITAIVGGQETDPVGPRVVIDTDQGSQEEGALVAVVPQKPVKLAGIDGFYGFNIGTDFPGSYTVDDKTGTITMMASGWDIQTHTDGEYFLAVPVKGDVTVTARIVSGPTETASESTWNLGGPQIRASLDTGSLMAITQAAHTGEVQFKYRDTYDTSPPEEDDDPSADPTRRPLWMRVVRKGNDFRGYLSNDGKTFTPMDNPNSAAQDTHQDGGVHTIKDFPQEAYVGLALCGHHDGEYSTAVFDNFTITSP